MKPIKVCEDNAKALETALAAVNGRAEAFCITTGEELDRIARRAESRLDVLPKASRPGARVAYRPSGPSASRYKYTARTTVVTLERRSAGWYLTDVRTDTLHPKAGERLTVWVTTVQRDEIARRAVADMNILPDA